MFTLTVAWWQVPAFLALLVLGAGLYWAVRLDDGGQWNFAPAFIGCGTVAVTAALLLGSLFAWLAGR